MGDEIHIIGGGANIGRWFAEHVFKERVVFCYDHSRDNLEKLPPNIRRCQIVDNDYGPFSVNFKEGSWVVLAIPDAGLPAALKGLSAHTKAKSFFIVFTSVQSGPLELVRNSVPKDSIILGCHPLFGPLVQSPVGQIVTCTDFDEKHSAQCELIALFESVGLILTYLTPKKHDEFMSVVQALTHFCLIGFMDTIRVNKIDPSDLMKLSTPKFQFLYAFGSRIIKQTSTTIGSIQSTQSAKEMRAAFLKQLQNLHERFSADSSTENCAAVFDPIRKDLVAKQEVEEGVEIANVAVDSIQRFEELLLRYKLSRLPFIFKHRETGEFKIAQITKIGHNMVYYNEATKIIQEPGQESKYVVGLTPENRENYSRNRIVCPAPRPNEIRKSNIKLLTRDETNRFHRHQILPASFTFDFENKNNYSPSYIEKLLPLLIRDVYGCHFNRKFQRRGESEQISLKIIFNPSVTRATILDQTAALLAQTGT